MEFSVFRQVLIRALGHMQSIVEKRATLPILMNVKIEVADDLILSATNVDLELVEHLGTGIRRILKRYDKSIYHFFPHFIKVSIKYNEINTTDPEDIKNKAKKNSLSVKSKYSKPEFCNAAKNCSFVNIHIPPSNIYFVTTLYHKTTNKSIAYIICYNNYTATNNCRRQEQGSDHKQISEFSASGNQR